MRIIEIESGKKPLSLAAGLIWYPLETLGSAQSKEIDAFAKANNDDLKIIRQGSSPHVGLANKNDGAQPGQLSIAALIADVLAEAGHRSCLTAIQHPTDRNLLLFLSVRDGVILADGDIVGTRDEIRVRLVGDVAYGGWDFVICPDEWGVLNGQERDLESFLTPDNLKASKKWRISEVSIPWKKAILPIAIFLLIAIAASYGWSVWQKKKQHEADLLRIQQEEAISGQKIAPAEPPKPWPLMPYAAHFAQACTQAYRHADLSGGNWKLESVICENGALTIKWNKTTKTAWISHLLIIHPEALIAADTMSATVVIPITTPPSNDFDAKLPISRGITSRYQDLASRYGLTITLNQPIAPTSITPLPGQTAIMPIASTTSWQALQVNVDSSLDPLNVISVIDYPGLRLKRIDFEQKSGVQHYKLTGEQYVLF